MAHFAKFVDMAKTPEQVNEEMPAIATGSSLAAKLNNIPKYPWGLCINLEDDQLEKLGIEGDCEVGDIIHLCAMAEVTACSQNKTEGKTKHRIELQITHLACEDEDNENGREEKAKRRYGGDDDEAED